MNPSLIPLLAVLGWAATATAVETAIPETPAAAAPAPVLTSLETGKISFVGGNSVKISGNSQPAKMGDSFPEKAELETGTSPVTEVTFGEGSVMRLGENSKVSYSGKERVVRVAQGTVLFVSAEGKGGITLQGAQASGQVAGSTAMGAQDSSGNFTFLLLEGSGAASVTVGQSAATLVRAGQFTTVTASASPTLSVTDVQADVVVSTSPLFDAGSGNFKVSEKLLATIESQSEEIQNDLKALSGLPDGPESAGLAMLCGVEQDTMSAAKNILLRPVDTAAGESSSETPGGGTSFGSLLAVSEPPADARQESAAAIVAASAPPSSGDGLAGTDTAAGGGDDLSATETAAGGGRGADTQAPLSPVTSSPIPGLTTPV
jgi:hypothetical protein